MSARGPSLPEVTGQSQGLTNPWEFGMSLNRPNITTLGLCQLCLAQGGVGTPVPKETPEVSPVTASKAGS